MRRRMKTKKRQKTKPSTRKPPRMFLERPLLIFSSQKAPCKKRRC